MLPHLRVVCVSVRLMHPGKAVGWNEMPFDRDTREVPSNIVPDRPQSLMGRDPRGVGAQLLMMLF